MPKPKNHPTGITAAVATLIVVIAHAAGLDLSPDSAALIVGAVSAVVSLFSPRQIP